MATEQDNDTKVVAVGDENSKVLDLSDAGDDTFRYIRHGIEHWRETNARMHFIPDTEYKSDMDQKYVSGMFDGLMAAGAGLIITSTGFLLWPLLQKGANKLAHLIYRN